MLHKGGQNQQWREVHRVATKRLSPRGSATLHSGRQKQRWPTIMVGGYMLLAANSVPNAPQRGAK